MALKVLDEHLVHSLGIGWVGTAVTHRATPSVKILPHDHGHLPDARVRFGGARRDHAIVEDFVVESVGPRGRLVLVDGHGRIVGKVQVVQHLEHAITAHLRTITINRAFEMLEI